MTRRSLTFAVIILAWAASMFLLVERHYGIFSSAADYTPVDVPESLLTKDWMGIYQAGDKIGYTMNGLEKSDDGYNSTEYAFMRIRVMDTEKTIELTANSQLDGSLHLRAFDFDMKSDVNMKVTGTVRDKTLLLTVDSAGAKTTKEIPLKEMPLTGPSATALLLKEGLETGRTISVPIVEPSTLSYDVMKIDVVGREPLMVMGSEVSTYRLKSTYKGSEVMTWVDSDGVTLRQDTLGLTFIKEPEDEAKRIGRPSLDIVAQFSVHVDKSVPPHSSYMRARLSGISLEGLALDGGAQSLNGDVLEIEVPSPTVSSGKIDESPYLAPTPLVQSSDQRIVALSRELAPSGTERAKAARLIYDWVFKNVVKVPAMTVPSATEVLDSMRGDCNEHTTLYTAIARAAGVPTRMAIGLAYQDGAFYYHAWPEVYLGGWVPVDPTLGQYPADATHIRLFTGEFDEQVRLASVIGKIGIDILEIR